MDRLSLHPRGMKRERKSARGGSGDYRRWIARETNDGWEGRKQPVRGGARGLAGVDRKGKRGFREEDSGGGKSVVARVPRGWRTGGRKRRDAGGREKVRG